MKKNAILFLIFSVSVFKLISNPLSVKPVIKVGYLFKAKFTFGFDLDFNYNIKNKINVGISISQSYANVKIRNVDKGLHSIFQLNGYFRNDRLDFRMGRGIISNNWGWENRSKCITKGTSIEITSKITTSPLSPWLGINIQKKKWNWEWFDTNYYQIHTKFVIPNSASEYKNLTNELGNLIKN